MLKNFFLSIADDLQRDAASDSEACGFGIRAKMLRSIRGFIPRRVSNRTVLAFFELLRKRQKRSRKGIPPHRESNEKSYIRHLKDIERSGGFVEDQASYGDMVYGRSNMAFSGCEIIAVFNALFSLSGEHVISLPELISAFERDGMVMDGSFGTAPKAVAEYLSRQGYRTEITTKHRDFEAFAQKYDDLILTMYNDRDDLGQAVHSIHISKDHEKLTAHNVCGDGRAEGPFRSMEELMAVIMNGRAKGISLIGIGK